MRRRTLISFTASAVTLLSAIAVGFMVYQPPRSTPAMDAEMERPPWDVCFVPGRRCTQVVVNALEQAKTTVLVQGYSFTSMAIAQALVDAHQRGIPVVVILDKGRLTERNSRADVLDQGGVSTWIDGCHAAAHNKVIIIDEEIVMGGSFNFTTAAEEDNAENLLVMRDRALAARYIANWQGHKTHSKLYAGRMSSDQYRCDRPSKKAGARRP